MLDLLARYLAKDGEAELASGTPKARSVRRKLFENAQ
jgi:hypothetical protein